MDKVSGVGVIDKAISVVQAIAAHGPSALAELQAATGLPRATAHRLAVALEEHGVLRREPNGSFALGFELIGLGHAAAETFPLGRLARPHLERLRDETGESVQLYVREGDQRRCVVSLQSPHALRWMVPEGSLMTLERGSAAKVLNEPAGGRDAVTWAESVEEREPGVASVSAPVVDRRGVTVAAISVSGPVERMSREPGKAFGRTVVDCARTLADDFRFSMRQTHLGA